MIDKNCMTFNSMEKEHANVKKFINNKSKFVYDHHYMIAKLNKAGNEVFLCAPGQVYLHTGATYWKDSFDDAYKTVIVSELYTYMESHKKECKGAYIYCFQEMNETKCIVKGYKVE